jgi:hypothetical protein
MAVKPPSGPYWADHAGFRPFCILHSALYLPPCKLAGNGADTAFFRLVHHRETNPSVGTQRGTRGMKKPPGDPGASTPGTVGPNDSDRREEGPESDWHVSPAISEFHPCGAGPRPLAAIPLVPRLKELGLD